MTIALELQDFFEGHDEKGDDFALILTRWMATRDPKGKGMLLKSEGVIKFTFTDGSGAMLDTNTGELKLIY